MVGADPCQVGVVDLRADPAGERLGFVPIVAELAERRVELPKYRLLLDAHRAGLDLRFVERGEPLSVSEHQVDELALSTLARPIAIRGRLIDAACGDPAPDSLELDRGRERLVEGRAVLHVDDLVGELVEDQTREIDLRPGEEGREDRVGEPAERRVRRHSARGDVVAVGAHLIRECAAFSGAK